MRDTLTALVAGLLLGTGLLVSGMANPANVLAFLDVAGNWNPALALTMGSAVVVAAPAFRWARTRRPMNGGVGDLPATTSLDVPLVAGSLVFGIGWGMSGICPGPSLLLVTGGTRPAMAFFAAMAIGLSLGSLLRAPGRGTAAASAGTA